MNDLSPPPTPSPPDSDQSVNFPVVGIGGSAGGFEALEELLDHLPADTGMAFVVVTHQHPRHNSLLPELLSRDTAMSVGEAKDGALVEANHVYVCPPGSMLGIERGRLRVQHLSSDAHARLPIDYFFRSLAADQKERAICIVLSGTGSDGTLGLQAIKGESGMVMVQSPTTAKYAGMPSSAEATGLVDFVLAPQDMPRQLIAYVSGSYLRPRADKPGYEDQRSQLFANPESVQKIFSLLRTQTGHDFASYKMNTIRRRIERRMNLHQIDGLEDYVHLLQENRHEADLLFQELLISVTRFFRDVEVWNRLAKGPLTQLLQGRTSQDPFRVWVPGCATGEEVYTLAILIQECMDQLNRPTPVEIFGTDLDSRAIDFARRGVYPSGIRIDVSPQRLQSYFVSEESGFRIRKEIREMAIFAPQNIINDPPFTRLDLLSCRNLLIYLNSDLQRRLLPLFYCALKPGGVLILGPSETIGSFTELFDPIDSKWKIFRRKETSAASGAIPQMPPVSSPRANHPSTLPTVPLTSLQKPTQLAMQVERLALARFAPAFVIINDSGDIVHVFGHTGRFLELAQGHAKMNVFEMARGGLSSDLALLIRKAKHSGEEVVRDDIPLTTDGESIAVQIGVLPIQAPEALRGLLMVTMRATPAPVASQLPPQATQKQPAAARDQEDDRIEFLQRELRDAKETHQATLEDLEASNEELKSSNEELQSTNEELQSTNEELETSKEEMQSLNEELTTVNAELQSKVDDLSRVNDDMQNLLNSTDIATIFLDNDLNIKRFTEQATNILSLRHTDVGRPIRDLKVNLDYQGLVLDCKRVLDSLVIKKLEVCSNEGNWYLMRILPYRTTEDVIDGLVVTFVNINDLKAAEKVAELRDYFASIFETIRQPLIVLDEDFSIISANRACCDLFGMDSVRCQTKSLYTLNNGQWDIAELRELLEHILPRNTSFSDFLIDREFPGLGRRKLLLNARRLEAAPSLPGRILLAIQDVTQYNSGR